MIRVLGTYFVWFLVLLALPGCQTVTKTPDSKIRQKPTHPTAIPLSKQSESTTQSEHLFDNLQSVSWTDLPGLINEKWSESWSVWMQSCRALQKKSDWREVCLKAQEVDANNTESIQTYWQQYFNVYSTMQNDEALGLMTGYYQPELKGSKTWGEQYPVPLYKVPSSLITVNLNTLFPELKNKRVRGRLQGQTLGPYYTRAEIEQKPSPIAGNEVLWVNDPIEAFFLQVQGSGVVVLENGERVYLGYADQNGHPYQSIGKLLVNKGDLTLSEASMQGIKNWALQHPQQVQDLLNSNPSYVFFKILPSDLTGPLGALAVPLTAKRSIAIDPAFIPLGAPVYIDTTYPNSTQTFQQLMMAQDTGGAIKGSVRADIFWGLGETAGKMAGAMRQQGRLWVWLPKTFLIPSN